jgi:alanine racemase
MYETFRPTRAVIDLDNLEHNFRLAREHAPGKTIIPVVKADAYGHGVITVTGHLVGMGCDLVAVSLLEEALEIRAHFPDLGILMMGPAFKDDLETVSRNRITMTVYDQESLHEAVSSGFELDVHLKVDTGMHRWGIRGTNEVVQAASILDEAGNITLSGLYTHLSTADCDPRYMESQINLFKEVLARIARVPGIVHVSNSSAIFKIERDLDFTTHARLGIALYGLSDDVPDPVGLRHVMTFESAVASVKTLERKDKLGYGATYEAQGDERIAVIPVGYADGLQRGNRDGAIEVAGIRVPLVGTICMDACFAKVGESVKRGDMVRIFGGKVTTSEVAKRLSTITYEIVTGISKRVPRTYVRKGMRP